MKVRPGRLLDAVDEGRTEAVAQAAAHDDGLQVEQVLGVGQGQAEGPHGLVDQLDRHLVALLQRVPDGAAGDAVAASSAHDAEQVGGAALFVVPAAGRHLHPRPARVRLEAAAHPAAAAAPAVLDDRVADLAGRAPALAQLATQDQAAADARPDEHAEQVLVGPAGAALPLAEDRDPDVVVDPDLDAAERPGHRRADDHRLHLEPGHV